MKQPFITLRRLSGALAVVATVLLAPGVQAASPATSAAPRELASLYDAAAAGDTTPFTAALAQSRTPAEAALLRAAVAAARLDAKAANEALDAYFAKPDTDPRRQAIAWSTRAEVAMAQGDYATAANAARSWQGLPQAGRRPREDQSMAQLVGIAGMLAAEPRQRVEGGTPGTVPTSRDKAGLRRAGVTINGEAQDAVLDTGANLSVVSASAAKRLGLRLLEGAASVGSSTSREVPSRLAIADKLTIAGMTLSHVVFLVMDDAQLTFPLPGGYRIDAIIGFPVFKALQRVRFDTAGALAVGSAAGPALTADNLRTDGNNLYVLARVGGMPLPLHLDTGASHSALTNRFARKHPQVLAGLGSGSKRFVGAGSQVVKEKTAVWKAVSIEVGKRTTTLPDLEISTVPTDDEADRNLGAIGQNLLDAFEAFTLDFDTMSFEFGPNRP